MSTAIKVGDKVRRTRDEFHGMKVGDTAVVKRVEVNAWAISVELDKYDGKHDSASLEVIEEFVDAIDPSYYEFPGGHEVRHISAHLTGFGSQALQYVARSTRLDGKNKGDTVENLQKAVRFLEWEIERIKAAG
ncbi:hypothetical protein SEA_ERENYEAGER_69 [Microbacterium phage Erenyeager]|nr:hypothetical protein SEA_ERENYEAGER_69 [Microbacterium phage Erenyeager]